MSFGFKENNKKNYINKQCAIWDNLSSEFVHMDNKKEKITPDLLWQMLNTTKSVVIQNYKFNEKKNYINVINFLCT